MAGCSILIRISPIRKEKQKPAKRQVFIFGGDGEYPLAFFQRKNRGICQRSHWRMNTPLGCSILIRISPSRREKRKPAKRQVSVFGGDGEIRTLEELLTLTRFPIVRARPTTRHLRVCSRKQFYSLCSLAIIMHPGAKVKPKFLFFGICGFFRAGDWKPPG